MKIGIDSVENLRFEKIIKKQLNLEKIFSFEELENIKKRKNPFVQASGYFAVKEAFLKALGVGIFNSIALNEISVEYCENGSPRLKMTPKIKKILKSFDFENVEISITHTKKISTAVCLVY